MDKMAQVMTEFAAKLGLEGARLWPDMVSLHWFRNVLELLLVPMVVCFLSSMAIYLWPRAKFDFDTSGEAWTAAVVVVCIGGGGILSIVYLLSFPTILGAVIWPEASLILRVTGR